MKAIFRIAALMVLIYLLANFSGYGQIFRHASGFLMLTAISVGVYLSFKSKKTTSTKDADAQRATTYNSTEIINKNPVRSTGTSWIYGFITFIVVVYLFRDFLGNVSFRFFLFIDNIVRLGNTFDPVFMWAALGLFAGVVCGSFVARKKYRLPFIVSLIPAGIFILIIFILITVNHPLKSPSFNSETSVINQPTGIGTVGEDHDQQVTNRRLKRI